MESKIQYNIVKYNEVRSIVKDKSVIKYKIYLKDYFANIYINLDGVAIVVPFPSKSVVIFNSLDDAQTYIETNGIPIEENSNVFYVNRHRLNNFESSKSSFLLDLSELLEMEIKPSLDEDYLLKVSAALQSKLNNLTSDERWDLFSIPLAVFMGESLILSAKYKWFFIRIVYINPYLEPNICNVDGTRLSIWNTIRQMFAFDTSTLTPYILHYLNKK